MESANVEELMDTIGVKTQIVKEGTYKEAGTPTREWTPEERAELERLTKDTYELFITDVANARGLDIKHAKNYADAHIFSAKRAKDAGLIDRVGVKSQAKSEVEKLANIVNPVWKEKDKLESFMEQFANKGMMHLQNYFYGLKASF
jgi:protease-4